MNNYLKKINPKETNELLANLRRQAEKDNIPIITVEGISFLNLLIKIKNVQSVLEIGTAIGYSAINMALKNNCKITTIEREKDMYERAHNNIKKANLETEITLIYADALDYDETTLGQFDLIFIDAAKAQSDNFFKKYKSRLNPKGLIIADNLLFHGLIDQQVESRNLRQLLRKIDRFNKFVVKQEDFDTFIYSIGDGMSVSVKRGE
ncbi:MAG: O-methyltransferase [Candidatus Izimaplasma sp.]|nr:O-methyltransferase [Candidatus Izimaplasma bacterium]